jgi:putative phosphoribosyl transferase
MTTSTDHARSPAAVVTGIASQAPISVAGVSLAAELVVPRGAAGLIVFAHGSGSSHKSPRNRFVAHRLRQRGLGTLLFDALTADERRAKDDRYRFDVGLLARRLGLVTDWARAQPFARSLPIGYFGSSTGAAAAIVAAASRPGVVRALVSRGGRPDLAGSALGRVRAPLLLVVGSEDPTTLELNELALARLGSVARLDIVPGAGHLFEEPGALETVAELAGDWLGTHLASPAVDQASHPSA